jgi:hypothetical protein
VTLAPDNSGRPGPATAGTDKIVPDLPVAPRVHNLKGGYRSVI